MNIIQISDTHILAKPGETFDGVDSAATLTAVLENINARSPSPDMILLTGDLVHDPDVASYQRLNDLLRMVKVPVYALPGNHDDPAVMPRYLTGVQHDKRIEQAGWQILLLNSWLPDEHAGELPASELDWLEQQLKHNTLPTLVALHHPPVKIDSPWMDGMRLCNPDDFFRVIDRHAHVRAVVWGHIHQVFETRRDHVQLLGCPSTCVQFEPQSHEYATDTAGPGYRCLYLQDDKISSEIIRI
ncbi:MAG: phosphodiesterase [Gammaproteobacteria bacterium]